MKNLGNSPGETLRWLRHRRGLTLEQAARLLHTSAPVLSRKERGAATLSHDEVQAVITAFRLDARESYILVTGAGFLPAAFPSSGSINVQDVATTLLPHIAFPALIVDELLYLRAWNHCAQTIFELPGDGVSAVHPINLFFAPKLRERMGDAWQTYADDGLRTIQERTLTVRRRAAYQRMLDNFAQTYGPLFTERWEAVRLLNLDSPITPVPQPAEPTPDGSNTPPEDLANFLYRYPTAAGVIEFLLTRAALDTGQRYELNVYLPYGRENSARYDQLRAQLGPDQVCFGADPDN
jgi:transcriptional regulator with XRE-family HTH domain